MLPQDGNRRRNDTEHCCAELRMPRKQKRNCSLQSDGDVCCFMGCAGCNALHGYLSEVNILVTDMPCLWMGELQHFEALIFWPMHSAASRSMAYLQGQHFWRRAKVPQRQQAAR